MVQQIVVSLANKNYYYPLLCKTSYRRQRHTHVQINLINYKSNYTVYLCKRFLKTTNEGDTVICGGKLFHNSIASGKMNA